MSIPARPDRAGAFVAQLRSASLDRNLARVAEHTVVRVANVRWEADVATEKVHEINGVAREAATDYVLLAERAKAMTAGDPTMADEVRIFTETARLGAAEVLADLVDTYCRER